MSSHQPYERRAREDPVGVHQFVPENTAPKKIAVIQFSMLDGVEMAKLGEIPIINRDLYKHPTKEPMEYGPLDPHLGTSNKKADCLTCGEKLEGCPGHFGSIRLSLPVFHIGYAKAIQASLRMICKTCSRVLLTPEDKKKMRKKVRSKLLDSTQRKDLQAKMIKQCQNTATCPYCHAANGDIKKIGPLKFVHKKYKLKANDFAKNEWESTFENAIHYNPEISQHLKNCGEDMHPQLVRQLFLAVPPEDCELLGMNHKYARPEWMVQTHLLVPPCAIRPSVMMDSAGGSNEDDLTMKLTEIIWVSELIGQDLERGTPVHQIMDRWDVLQLQVALYINSEFPGIPLSVQSKKPVRGICQRLKGKQGRFRGNLSGKRVDFTARTVISPDPNLRIDEVGVPVDVASTLTYPEKVNKYNIEELRKIVLNGPTIHPGAITIVHERDGSRRLLKYGDRAKHAAELHIGDVVERHLRDGDVVLFNRQPSLHRISIMAHRARVMPWKTFRFNECACTPYNADFDGDEMNLHLPQTEEARAEARTLMAVVQNLAVPKSGELLISATQDFLTASFIITCRDSFYTASEFCQILAGCMEDTDTIDMPVPAVLKPMALYTGKQIFNALLQPNKKVVTPANLEARLAQYNDKLNIREELCMIPTDTYMVVLNGYLCCGRLDKSVLGGGKNTLFSHLLKYFSPETSADRMSKLAKLCARFMGNQGFSIGISDVTPSPELSASKAALVSVAEKECSVFITQFKSGTLTLDAGVSPEQALESKIEGTLSQVRDKAGGLCMDELNNFQRHNAPLMMTQCGSKGSKINIAQMIACLGQQTVSGSRVPNGFVNRSLPHFEIGAKDAAAKGFVSNSFYTGLTPTEFFFHTQGGREGLIDTAVKTAETGYMQRRLMKALEDLTVQYDGTVRSTGGNVVQFRYGDDGVEPTLTESDTSPFHLSQQWQHCVLTHMSLGYRCLQPYEIMPIVDAYLTSPDLQQFTDKFRQDVRDHFFCLSDKTPGIINQLITLRIGLGLPANDNPPGRFGTDIKEDGDAATMDYTLEDDRGDEKEGLIGRIAGVTKVVLDVFFKRLVDKMVAAQAEPGTAVGALAAQSIGEPCTQMTLKTFHFAGVASMNITQGVPRIREIINATKAISTPLIEVKLQKPLDKDAALRAKALIESATIGDVAAYIREIYEPTRCFVLIELDEAKIEKNKIACTGHDVVRAIVAHKKLKLKPEMLKVLDNGSKVQINPPDQIVRRGKDASLKHNIYFTLQHIKSQLANIPVAGLNTIKRAVIQEKEIAGTKNYAIYVEGADILGVMAQKGVLSEQTKSNHLMMIQGALGIEAARRSIIDEIATTMKDHGVKVDPRHLNLLADCMCSKGEILGITRFGISKMNDSALMLASFEKTTDYLFDAGQRALAEKIAGVSECIIMGRPIPLGTGLFSLLHKSTYLREDGVKLEPKPLLLNKKKPISAPTALPASATT